MTPKEAMSEGDELNLHMKNLFADAELRGGEITASGMGYEETIKHEDGRYLKTGKWLVKATVGWKTWRRGEKFADFILLDPEAVQMTEGARDKLLEVLQIQMDNSMAKIDAMTEEEFKHRHD